MHVCAQFNKCSLPSVPFLGSTWLRRRGTVTLLPRSSSRPPPTTLRSRAARFPHSHAESEDQPNEQASSVLISFPAARSPNLRFA